MGDTEYVESLLEKWRLLELLPECQKLGIDTECFRYITEDDLRVLVPDSKLGLRIKFRQRLKEWNALKNLEMSYNAADDHNVYFPQLNTTQLDEIPSNATPFVRLLASPDRNGDNNFAEEQSNSSSFADDISHDDPLQDLDSKSSIPLLSMPENVPASRSSSKNHTISLNDMLQSFKGRNVLAYYANHKKLDCAHRKKLVDTIATYFIDRDVRICAAQYDAITSEIVKRFPAERKETYYEKTQGKPALGKLLHRINNMRKLQRTSMRKKSRFNTSMLSQNKKKLKLMKIPDEIAFKESKEMLQNDFESWDELVDVWKRGTKSRVQEFLYTSDKFNDLKVPLESWPAITKPLGYTLIEIDFNTLYPDKSNMLADKWTHFLVKFMEICSTEIRDAPSKQLLNDIVYQKHISDDAFNCIIALMLGSVLRQCRLIKKVDGSLWKPTVLECQKSFIIHIEHIDEYEQAIEDYKWKCEASSLSLNPVILAVGQNLKEVNEFYVHFESFSYRFERFLIAFANAMGLQIEIDFNTLYPDKSNMLADKWTHFLVKFMEICSTEIRDAPSKQLLNDIVYQKHISDDAFNCIIALMLGSVLRQCRMIKKVDGSLWKPTVLECQKSFIIHIEHIDEYEQAIEDYKWKCEASSLSLNPVILAVGQNLKEVNEFYVHFESFSYRFERFLIAFAVCFKMYSVLNLRYPLPSESIWSFVEQYFYDIHNGSNAIRSTVLSAFINDMKT